MPHRVQNIKWTADLTENTTSLVSVFTSNPWASLAYLEKLREHSLLQTPHSLGAQTAAALEPLLGEQSCFLSLCPQTPRVCLTPLFFS